MQRLLCQNNENSKKPLRKFIKDTDYYNDSPLKHNFYQSFETKAACKTKPVSQTFKAETIDCEIEPFNYISLNRLIPKPNEDMSDSSYDLSLQDFNYWEFSDHGLGKLWLTQISYNLKLSKTRAF
ncbi:BAM_G0037380.mRNA.1.CDS.1 [Saccharomyces cerevisiae]|nr:BAM_G0037380.mRNA.1.CDS.1 [Saccharomyces cerevisiae]CAI7238848.1 BAM_G0037380.mRNA.1.CDS.1 [Saccharomyces cerevisiae]